MDSQDVNLFFFDDPQPLIVSGNIAIQRRIANVVGNIRGSRFFNRGFGSGAWDFVFRPITEENAGFLRLTLYHDFLRMDSDLNILVSDIYVTPQPEQKAYSVLVLYDPEVEPYSFTLSDRSA